MSRKCKNCNKYLYKIPGYKKIIKNEEEAKVFSDCLNKIVIVNDIFYRGFRDVVEFLNDKGLNVLMPAFKGNKLQLSTEEANISRKITKIRWVVEAVHGNDYNSILRYCCDCPNGERTVGCCSHVAAIIYYLSYGRYLSKIVRPAEVLTKLFATQSVPIVINYNSDDD
ncbi:unnamed protein product [Euphydryas editha]|uniref:SWIM-type domain-containing protein n=1 Tax=Euphydryas editha TaxID=104508 RepID=A0AAU9TU50_EUPED|nr:unnamed protein product [Euphydryas editha]